LGQRWRMLWEAGEDCIIRSLITCMLEKYYYGSKIKEDEMGDEKCTQNFGRET